VVANNSSVSKLIHGVSFNIADILALLVSGGFAIVQPDSVLSINAVEGYPLEDFSEEAVKSQIAEAQKIAGGSGSDIDIAEAKIELEVCHIRYTIFEGTDREQVLESLQAAMR
jgi:F0F1-type ATP synthase epsilon subunit